MAIQNLVDINMKIQEPHSLNERSQKGKGPNTPIQWCGKNTSSPHIVTKTVTEPCCSRPK